MKIIIFYGSIHKKRGNTHVIIEAFSKGAKEAGADVEVVLLAEMKIKNCRACLKCWTKTPGKCVLADDMPALLEKFMQADIVVMATPVYIHNVTGIMKTFLDRMTPIIDPHLIKLDNGDTGHYKRYDQYPKFGVIATGGFPGQNFSEFVSRYFNRLATEIYSEVVFEIYKSQAMILNMGEKSPLDPIVDEYKKNVRKAAKEVVANRRISEETAKQLDQPFVPEEMYIEEANKYWDSRIARHEDNT